MARAELELDDPLDGGDGARSTHSADDLLAQLAGDEVDRMLSEADAAALEPRNTDRPIAESERSIDDTGPPMAEAGRVFADAAAAADMANAAAGISDPVLDAAEAALDRLDADPASARKPDPVKKTRGRSRKPKAAASSSMPDAAARTDAVVQTDAVSPVDADAAASSTPAPAQEALEEMIGRRADDLLAQARLDSDGEFAAGVVPDPPSAADALTAEMEEDERAHFEALQRMKGGTGGDAASPAAAHFAADPAREEAPLDLDPLPGQEDGPTVIDEAQVDFSGPDKVPAAVPLLVRVLEWVNAPLAGLSDGVRAAIGKVAIVTTFNAAAVLLYVLIFRRHS